MPGRHGDEPATEHRPDNRPYQPWHRDKVQDR